MAEGIEVEDAPVFKTRDEIVKKQQVRLHTSSCTSSEIPDNAPQKGGSVCVPSPTGIDRAFHHLLHDEGSAARLALELVLYSAVRPHNSSPLIILALGVGKGELINRTKTTLRFL